jgi:M6 family metalloprotease-like protein
MRKRLIPESALVIAAVLAAIVPVSADITSRDGNRLPAGIRLRRQQNPRAFQFRYAYLDLVRQTRAARVALMSTSPSAADVEAASAKITVSGTRSVPVLAVMFANTAKEPYARTGLQDRLFGAAPDTMTTFYKENSFNLLTVNGTVFDWHKLPQPDTFYEGQDFQNQGQTETCNGTCDSAKLGDLIKSVLDARDATVDFSQFDNDGPDNKPNSGDDNGVVDFVAFVHPELGGECTGAQNRNIWSHRWNYSGWKNAPYQTQDNGQSGKKIQIEDYVIMPGLNCDGSTMIDIGVFAHEFGHAFGLPDLYDTVQSNGVSQGIGNWCLMASGSWGGDGQSPARPSHMSAWAKSFLGWVQPKAHEEDAGDLSNFALKAVHDDRTAALKVAITPSEYYLIEYRPKKGFDQNLPFGGVLIWKVNDAVIENTLANNTVNGNSKSKGVDLIEADGRNELDQPIPPGNRGDKDDPYPSNGKRKLDTTSNPKSIGGIAICNIADPAATATLSVLRSTQGVCKP